MTGAALGVFALVYLGMLLGGLPGLRLDRTGIALLGAIALLTIGDRVLKTAARLDPPGLRSLDAIHLATALRLASDLTAFVSYDVRQLEAAATLGLPVTSPL